MIDVQLRFRGAGSEQRPLPAVPPVGSYMYGPDDDRRLWVVSAVTFDATSVRLYLVAVGSGLAEELQAGWRAWAGQSKKEGNGT